MGSRSKPQQEMLQDDFDDFTGYRVLYRVEKFIAGWRSLVIFYLAMFIAGYAQVVESYLFWGTVTALLMVYWEPYLSPPFPWMSDSNRIEDDLSQQTVQRWGSRPAWMTPASAQEQQAVRQWLYCLRRCLPQKQQVAHRLMQCCVVLPCLSMGAGVVMQKIDYTPQDAKALYSGAIVFTLMAIYTLLTVGVNLAYLLVLRRKLVPAAEVEDWQQQDMMYFTCKILGQCLNTVVQTLVAGAFVAYMPKAIFWLGAVVTGMSYTATNLLFDMGPVPVQEEEVDSHWLPHYACCSGASVASADSEPYGSKLDDYAGPCMAILAMLTMGKSHNMLHLYLDDSAGACVDKCLKCYQQLLYALVCLGLCTCYYAFTIGFLGLGPVTVVYRYMQRGCFTQTSKSSV